MARKPRPQFSGVALKQLRNDQSLTMQECSRIADVTLSTWYKWENGSTPNTAYLPGIVEALSVNNVWDLFRLPA